MSLLYQLGYLSVW